MSKRRSKPQTTISAEVARRLATIGPYEVVAGEGYCEIHFDDLDALATELAPFRADWTFGATEKVVPTPDDRLFDIWERYARRHGERCEEFRRRLFDLYSASDVASYELWQWKALKRRQPTLDDLGCVVTQGTIDLRQLSVASNTEFELRASFAVFWNSHGVTFKLDPNSANFPVVAWSVGEA